MAAHALYFPNIELPNNAWTARALLYWDSVYAIIPPDVLQAPEQLRPYMRSLLLNRLVEPLAPKDHLYEVAEFDRCFIRFASQPHLLEKWRGAAARNGGRGVRIHAEKLGHIPDFLVSEGLAHRLKYPWYAVNAEVAKYFMTYLATSLGSVAAIDAVPVTDRVGYAALVSEARITTRDRPLEGRAAIRSLVLRALLPCPARTISIDSLQRFKERHGSLLPRFRNRIEAHCIQVASLDDPELRAEASRLFIDESRAELDAITAAMRPAFGAVVFGSIAPLLGSGLLWHGGGPENPMMQAGAALSFAGTAYQAIASVRNGRREAMNRPLAYLALARRSFARDEAVG
jgi:hypothetical protein